MPDGAIASPLNLLLEEEEARDVLLLTFTLNLEFWERYALSVARSLGARVTVVSDAAMAIAEHAHVRYAGITYLDGRAACLSGGAFHPKLLVISGEGYATVAIGSGNVTLPGWHDNAELWTVLRGDAEEAPSTFTALADWLRTLDRHVRFSPGVPEALRRVADSLAVLPASAPGPELVTTAEQPILAQLPSGEVRELVVSAPFFDGDAAALRAICERFQPKKVSLALQPKDAVANGAAISDLLGEYGGQAKAIESDRYHHGKLIEWVTEDGRFALTGSPNVSRSALLRTLADRGNCELALVEQIEESLAPAVGEVLDRERLEQIVFAPRVEEQPGLTLLGIARSGRGLLVRLLRPLDQPAQLELASGAEWVAVADLAVGQLEFELQLQPQVGSAMRVRQGALISNTCFLSDPARYLRTRVEHLGRVDTNEEDVFLDAKVAEALALDIAELRQFLRSTPTAGSGAGGGGGERKPAPVSYTSWEEYLDACEARIGERLLAYGLALPAFGSGQGQAEESEVGDLEGDEEVADQQERVVEQIAAHHFGSATEHQRRRYRRWCERLAALAPELPLAGRLVVLRLLLDAIRGELFDSPEGWLPIVAQATAALGAPGEAFEAELQSAGSLAAVSLGVMRRNIRGYSDWDALRFPYEAAATAVAPLLLYRDADTMERYSRPLAAAFGVAVAPAFVDQIVDSLLNPDLIGEAARLAEDELGLSIERDGSVLHVDDARGDLRRAVLRVLSLCETETVGVVVYGSNSHITAAAWKKPTLAMVSRTPAGKKGAVYELKGFGPGAYKDDVQELPKPQHEWSGAAAPEEASEVFELVGLPANGLG